MADWACARQAIPNTILTLEADNDEISLALSKTESRCLMLEKALLPRLIGVVESSVPIIFFRFHLWRLHFRASIPDSLQHIVFLDAPTPADMPSPASLAPLLAVRPSLKVIPMCALEAPVAVTAAPVQCTPDTIFTGLSSPGGLVSSVGPHE